VKPPVEQFKFFRHHGMMPRGTAAIKAAPRITRPNVRIQIAREYRREASERVSL
jgi:hypothetical protein